MLFLNRFNGFGTLAPAGGIVTAQYWRINVTALNGGDPTGAISDMTFKDSGGSAISVAGGTASASSSAGGNAPANAFDGDANNDWAFTTGVSQWVKMAFSGTVTPYSLDMQGVNASYPAQSVNAPSAFDIQYSLDDISWFTIVSPSGQTGWTAGEVRNFVIQS